MRSKQCRDMARALGLLACLFFACIVSSSAECRLRLDIDTNSTVLDFTGVSAASLVPGPGFPVDLKDPENTRIGLSGPMYLNLPSASKCPQDLQGWLAAASGSIITSAPSPFYYKPLTFYPESIQLEVMGVPLNVSSLALNLSISGSAASGAANPVKLGVNATITDGYVFSDTVLTGGPQLQQLTGIPPSASSSNANFGIVKQGSSSYLSITLPNFNISFVGKTSGVMGGKPWSGSLSFSFSGPLKMSGILGCPKDCGNFGRCVASNASTATPAANSSSEYGCECECGWTVDPTTGRCEVPAGTCPIYSSEAGASNSAAALTATKAGESCSGGNSASLMAANGVCPNSFGYDVMSKTCQKCDTDWSGTGCKQCTTDNACRVSGTMQSCLLACRYYVCS
eukprot:GHUV01017939.1.p1 GENE.GHUV01017939.1~~GHUV01017939.1.p1  ORF type:complete len:398 (+),score=66.01 GHUV01017939.1:141-1334(+)